MLCKAVPACSPAQPRDPASSCWEAGRGSGLEPSSESADSRFLKRWLRPKAWRDRAHDERRAPCGRQPSRCGHGNRDDACARACSADRSASSFLPLNMQCKRPPNPRRPSRGAPLCESVGLVNRLSRCFAPAHHAIRMASEPGPTPLELDIAPLRPVRIADEQCRARREDEYAARPRQQSDHWRKHDQQPAESHPAQAPARLRLRSHSPDMRAVCYLYKTPGCERWLRSDATPRRA